MKGVKRMNIKLSDAISNVIDRRPKIPTFSIWEVAGMVNSRYDWEEFGDLDIDTVAEWIAQLYGWEKEFTMEEAKDVCLLASNDGYRGARGWYK
jgi:hypothetical protein